MPKDGWRKPYPTIEPEGRGVRAIAWPSPRSTCENTRVFTSFRARASRARPRGSGLSLLSILPGSSHLQGAALAAVAADNGPSWSSSMPTTADQ
jgi:hypothetical protein